MTISDVGGGSSCFLWPVTDCKVAIVSCVLRLVCAILLYEGNFLAKHQFLEETTSSRSHQAELFGLTLVSQQNSNFRRVAIN
jgi:hypothetical protein